MKNLACKGLKWKWFLIYVALQLIHVSKRGPRPHLIWCSICHDEEHTRMLGIADPQLGSIQDVVVTLLRGLCFQGEGVWAWGFLGQAKRTHLNTEHSTGFSGMEWNSYCVMASHVYYISHPSAVLKKQNKKNWPHKVDGIFKNMLMKGNLGALLFQFKRNLFLRIQIKITQRSQHWFRWWLSALRLGYKPIPISKKKIYIYIYKYLYQCWLISHYTSDMHHILGCHYDMVQQNSAYSMTLTET